MTPQIYNFPDVLVGNTINAKEFTLTSTVGDQTNPIDLTSATIRLELTLQKEKTFRQTKTIDNGLTMVDAAAGKFRIDSFILDQFGTWSYKLNFKFPDDVVKTYVVGSINVLEKVDE